MAITDEKIIFTTDIDDSGFNKGLIEMKETAENIMESITKTLSSGNGAVKNLSNCVVDMNKVIISSMRESSESTDSLVNALKGINSAMGALEFVSNSIVPMIKAFQEAELQVKLFKASSMDAAMSQETINGALSAGQVIVGLFTGEIGLATAATSLWNGACTALGGPIGVVATVLGTLVAGVGTYLLLQGDFLSGNDKELEALKAKGEAIEEEIRLYDEKKQKRADELSSNLAQIDNIRSLTSELDKLVDSNGRVKEGQEGRVSFILGEYNSAMGTEYELVDGMISKYGELASSSKKALDDMRGETILASLQKNWQDAVNTIGENTKILIGFREEKAKADEEFDAIEAEIALQKEEGMSVQDARETARYQKAYERKEEANKNLSEQEELVKKSLDDISLYEDAKALWSEGRQSEFYTTIAARQGEHGETTLATLQGQYDLENEQYLLNTERMHTTQATSNKVQMDNLVNQGIEAAYQQGISNENDLAILDGFISKKIDKSNTLRDGLKNNVEGITEDDLREQQNLTVQGVIAYGNFTNQKVSEAISLRERFNRNDGEIEEAAVLSAERQAENALTGYARVVKNATGTMDKLPPETNRIFGDAVKPMHDQLEGSRQGLWDKAKSIADGILGSLKKAFDINSPSRKTRAIFKSVMLGAEAGLEIEENNLFHKTGRIAEEVINRIASPATELESTFKNMNLEAMFDTIQAAILSEQLKMASVVQTQSKIEMLKTNILKAETQSIYGKVDALIENHVDLDGRELAVALAPMISEELAFNWR